MIYQFVLFAMGPHGRLILDFIVKHQLVIMSVLFVILFIEMYNNHSKKHNEDKENNLKTNLEVKNET